MSITLAGTSRVRSTWSTRLECLAQRGPVRLDGRALAADVETEAREANSGREHVLDDQVRLAR